MICHASYNFCATCIVRDTENHSFLLASCCNVEVVKGAEGVFFHGLVSIFDIWNSELLQSHKNSSTSSGDLKSVFSVAGKSFFDCPLKVAIVLKKLAALNFSISLSLSTIRRTATDCTLPAESPLAIFFQSTGESSNHTRRSSTLLACWASTKFISMVLGLATAHSIAFFVISWNTILLVFFTSNFNWLATCRHIASHSRSSSVAIHTRSAALANFLSSAIVFFLSGLTS